jgi:hypothetical protein
MMKLIFKGKVDGSLTVLLDELALEDVVLWVKRNDFAHSETVKILSLGLAEIETASVSYWFTREPVLEAISNKIVLVSGLINCESSICV